MRKWVIGAVIAGLLVSLPAVSFAAKDTGLKDLKGHWSEAQVMKAVETGWVNGYPDKTFKPEETITRAEFTKMALAADRLIPGSENAALYENDSYVYNHEKRGGSEFGEQPQRGLVDISDHWLTKQGWTKIALNYGMLVSEDYAHSGYKFNPDKPITRYEMAIIMDRMLGLVYPANENHKGESTGFTDDANMKDWQRGYVIEAYNAGVLQGYPDGSFHGEKTATRAEAVTMVQNALDYMEEGVDNGIKVEVMNSAHPEQTIIVSNAVAQIIDGKIYVPLERCYAAENRFSQFLSECIHEKTVLLELGVGFNTPTIIRFPFEKLAREHENITLVRLSRSKAMVPASLGVRAIGINADMARSITDISAKLKGTEATGT